MISYERTWNSDEIVGEVNKHASVIPNKIGNYQPILAARRDVLVVSTLER